MNANQNHVHITGICGVATSALAAAFHARGWKVTGSDKGFFPPVSTELERLGISFYAGWHPDKMIAEGTPTFVIAGTASGTQNPETLYAREHDIPIKSDAEVRGEFFARTHSIVCAGTWGKTSSTALLSHILMTAGYDPSFVIGGLPLSGQAARLGDSDWSVIEGDEYKSSPWDNRPKFDHLKSTHVLLTAVSWDHADLYPTEQSYFDVFKRLTASLPAAGLIVANADHPGIDPVLQKIAARVVRYGTTDAEYTHSGILQTKKGLDFVIHHKGFDYAIHSPMIGAFQAENILGCFAMAHEIGIPVQKIIAAIATFQGLKRRLEKRLDGDYFIFDDIAHSPEKASAVLKNLASISQGTITAVFEPNIGGRRRESISKYDHAFANATRVIIPRLTKLKLAENDTDRPMEGDELASVIGKTHPDSTYIDDDAVLVRELTTHLRKGDVIAFLGSHGFRGMIEETIKRVQEK